MVGFLNKGDNYTGALRQPRGALYIFKPFMFMEKGPAHRKRELKLPESKNKSFFADQAFFLLSGRFSNNLEVKPWDKPKKKLYRFLIFVYSEFKTRFARGLY